jgi:ceramide glucosyltransferase
LNGFGIAVVAAAIGCRLVLQFQVDHTLKLRSDRWWLAPLRDLIAFGVFVASFFVNVVRWDGQRYQIRADGSLIAQGERET